ncbi:sugar ABC transporter ATP-binding protein [Nocardioides endophyticus]|uniref:Sugar ABC transporter ATP-binding protein n=1 Tax=Nocardioides endophyticus TaxID=1353775 RepID=A0ABP8Y750_9ACTN
MSEQGGASARHETGVLIDEPILVCTGVTKNYGGIQALRGVDLEIRAGEVHGLVGPNGAGKSTLMKVVAGAVTPSSGTIHLAGEVVEFHDPRDATARGIALVPQELTTLPEMTIAENITLGAEPVRWGLYQRAQAQARAERALAVVGITLDPDMPVQRLKPHFQRLVMIATAFDRDAELVILDEPTAGLPPDEAATVLDAVERLRASGVAVVYVSHHLSEVARICDRVTCVREGRGGGVLERAQVTKDALIDLIHDATGGPEKRPTDDTLARRTSAGARAGGPGHDAHAAVLRHVSSADLTDVSVSIRATGVTGIAGLLGSGAKDLAGLLAGAVDRTDGAVLLNGVEVTSLTPTVALAHGVSYLAGDRSRSALRTSTISENVSISSLRAWSRGGFIRSRYETREVRSILERLGVRASGTRRIGELSGGNQQRALVGRCLASDASLVILDEPTIGVDVAAREDLWSLVRDIAESRAVVVASSEPEELVALCQQVICVANGRIVDVIERSRLSVANITSAIA